MTPEQAVLAEREAFFASGAQTVPLRTEVVDGLEFEVPTWDPAPAPWNPRGAWRRDPEVEARVLAGLRAAAVAHEGLEAHAAEAAPVEWWLPDVPSCGTFWGSHGCSLAAGHGGLCVCTTGTLCGRCSAGLKWGRGGTMLLWWADDESPRGLRLSPHRWEWFR